jgi:hypothetical protein
MPGDLKGSPSDARRLARAVSVGGAVKHDSISASVHMARMPSRRVALRGVRDRQAGRGTVFLEIAALGVPLAFSGPSRARSESSSGVSGSPRGSLTPLEDSLRARLGLTAVRGGTVHGLGAGFSVRFARNYCAPGHSRRSAGARFVRPGKARLPLRGPPLYQGGPMDTHGT